MERCCRNACFKRYVQVVFLYQYPVGQGGYGMQKTKRKKQAYRHRNKMVNRQVKDRLFRFLIYLAKEYQKLIEQAEESIYGTERISLPTPQCIIFYNGQKDMPEEQIMRLSDAFQNRTVEADVELKVRVLNINYGHNKELLEKCKVLGEYAQFVAVSRQYALDGRDMKESLERAIQYCIEHDILADFLRKYRAEVLGMLLEEFDKKKYERTIRKEGIAEGMERVNRLTQILLKQNRVDDLKHAAEDTAFQEQLFREFDL